MRWYMRGHRHVQKIVIAAVLSEIVDWMTISWQYLKLYEFPPDMVQ